MPTDTLIRIKQLMLPFAELLGITFVSASPDKIVAEMTVRDDLCTRPAVLHGGAIMAFADTLGATGTIVNLPEGAGTTTIESKTNFVAPAPVGTRVIGEATPVHRGRRTMIWQTRISTPGRPVGRARHPDPARSLSPLSEKVAHPLELVERAARRDDEHLVEAQQLDPLQPHPRFAWRTDQRDRRPLGKAARFRLVFEIDQDIGEDGIGAAGFAI